jgi:alpha-tubulin suppressor-like RCC1 family protein
MCVSELRESSAYVILPAPFLSSLLLVSSLGLSSLGCGLLVGVDFDAAYGKAIPEKDVSPNAPEPVVTFAFGRAPATCFVRHHGDVWCFGKNTAGSLGISQDTAYAPTPQRTALGPALHVLLGEEFGCAIPNRGGFRCHGNVPSPLRRAALKLPSQRRPSTGGYTPLLACTGTSICCALADGGVPHCFSPTTERTFPIGEPATAIYAGRWDLCATTAFGRVFCWGSPDESSAPDLSTMEPREVAGTHGKVLAITMGEWHTCALEEAGHVACWGASTAGQTGRTERVVHTPNPIPGLERVSEIAASDMATCALSDGRVACWGDNDHGELGAEATDTGAVVHVDLPPVRSLAAGSQHFCALGLDGAISCWGDNRYGQLGRGSSTTDGLPPGKIAEVNQR